MTDAAGTAPPPGRAARDQLWVPDATLAMAIEGYEFISRRCNRSGHDAFVTRLMGETTICMRGARAAEIFYDDRPLPAQRCHASAGAEDAVRAGRCPGSGR